MAAHIFHIIMEMGVPTVQMCIVGVKHFNFLFWRVKTSQTLKTV